MANRSKSSGKTTIKIPTPLYARISALIEGAGYNSVTDFIVYVLRDLVGERELETVGERELESAGERGERVGDTKARIKELEATWAHDLERAKRKLKSLGYL